jgi:hypothetical protein
MGHETHVETEVMDRCETGRKRLVRREQMMKVSARIAPAGKTVAPLLQRGVRSAVFVVLHVKMIIEIVGLRATVFPTGIKDVHSFVTGVARREHTIKEVISARPCPDDVLRFSDAQPMLGK